MLQIFCTGNIVLSVLFFFITELHVNTFTSLTIYIYTVKTYTIIASPYDKQTRGLRFKHERYFTGY
jgi:hypothetical protein